MEQTFEQMSQQFLAQAVQQYGEPFVIQREVTCCGITFPMTAGYVKRDGRHFLGIKSDLSQDGMCGETCYFLCCETLTQESWKTLCEIFRKIQDGTVPADDPAHLFTLVSFVIETNHVDAAVKKKIRRLRDERNYSGSQGGWSSLRVCVREEASDSYYCNGMGKAILECLTREEMPKPRKKFLGIF